MDLCELTSLDVTLAWHMYKYGILKLVIPSGNVEGANKQLKLIRDKVALEKGVEESQRDIEFIGVSGILDAVENVFVEKVVEALDQEGKGEDGGGPVEEPGGTPQASKGAQGSEP